jgi:hypothetical protein
MEDLLLVCVEINSGIKDTLPPREAYYAQEKVAQAITNGRMLSVGPNQNLGETKEARNESGVHNELVSCRAHFILRYDRKVSITS